MKNCKSARGSVSAVWAASITAQWQFAKTTEPKSRMAIRKKYEPSDAYLYHKVQSLPDSEVCHCKCSHTHQHCEPGAHWPFRKPRKQLDGLSERKQSLFICIWAASGSLLCRSHEATLITFACISAIAKWPRLQCTGDRHDAAFTSAASEQCVLSRGLASNPRSQIRLAWLWS